MVLCRTRGHFNERSSPPFYSFPCSHDEHDQSFQEHAIADLHAFVNDGGPWTPVLKEELRAEILFPEEHVTGRAEYRFVGSSDSEESDSSHSEESDSSDDD